MKTNMAAKSRNVEEEALKLSDEFCFFHKKYSILQKDWQKAEEFLEAAF
jgi:DNA anti-recombination protein RmuC